MVQEKYKKANGIKLPAVILALSLLQIVLISAADTATFDQILAPVQAVYDLVKYAVTIIAGLVLLFTGITYILSGGDAGKREKAKSMFMYVIVGLAVIWAAPFVIKLILGT
jgi:heme O synthase-like polyprenyltransferase